MELLQIPTAYFITKCDGQLLQIASAFLYKVRHGLLQIATGVTKCDGFITNCDRYNKVRWSLKIATVQLTTSTYYPRPTKFNYTQHMSPDQGFDQKLQKGPEVGSFCNGGN